MARINMKKTAAVKRKALFAAVGWILGIISACVFDTALVIKILVAGIMFSAIFVVCGKNRKFLPAVITVFALLGALRYSCYDADYRKLTSLSGREIIMTGVVKNIRYTGSDTSEVTVSGKISGIKTEVKFYVGNEELSLGDRVSVKGKIKNIADDYDPFADKSRTLGVFVQGSGLASVEKTGGRSLVVSAVRGLNRAACTAVFDNCPEREGAFISAILCSNRSRVTDSDKTAVYRSGLGHIFAVSGTHVVMLTVFISTVLKLLSPNRKLNSGITLALIWCFALFSGCAVPVVRACVMSSVGLFGSFFSRKSDPANSLGLAALLITLDCPYAVFSASFQLSFASAASFGILVPKICKDKIERPILVTAVASICVSLVTLPICAYFFSGTSLISPLTNILLIPLCTVCLFLAFAFLLTGFVFPIFIKLSAVFAKILLSLCKIFASVKFMYIGTYHKTTLTLLSIVFIAFLIFIAIRPKRTKAAAIKIIGIYAVMCIAAVTLDNLPKPDRVIVVSHKDDYIAAVIHDGDCVIYDMGANADSKGVYQIFSELTKINIDSVYIYADDESPTVALRTSEKDTVRAVFSRDLEFEKLGIVKVGTGFKTGGISTKLGENVSVSFDGNELVLGDGTIEINGKKLEAKRLKGIQVVLPQ